MLSPVDLIIKKRDGQSLNFEELKFMAQGAATGSIADYQLSAWLMANYLNGLESEERTQLTKAYIESGLHIKWSEQKDAFKNLKFSDKHSTGGVGDKVSFIIVPLAALLGLNIPMMSGRSLGHTGGTVDKLESIPGITMDLNLSEMSEALLKNGACLISQTKDLCPADKKLYALRDVTGTVSHIDLITPSIVSKKVAEGVGSVIFDVKTGHGAFMTELADSQKLAKALVKTSTDLGLKASAMITDMNHPLGCMTGNSLEIIESIWILKNDYPSKTHRQISEPLADLCCKMVAEMLVLADIEKCTEDALSKTRATLESAKAFDVFKKICVQQGADLDFEDKIKTAANTHIFKSTKPGYLKLIDAKKIGLANIKLGGGRIKSLDKIDSSVGFEFLSMPGDKITKDQSLIKVHYTDKQKLLDSLELVNEAVVVTSEKSDYSNKNLHLENIGIKDCE